MAQVAELYLDVKKTGHYTNDIINLRVGDNTDQILVHVLLNGEPHQNVESATLFAEKPDETIIANDPANVVDPSTISYPISEQLTAAAGNVTKAYFIINTTSSTDSFRINILPSVNPKGDSLDYIPGLEILQDKLNVKINSMKEQIDNIDVSDEVKKVMNDALDKAKSDYMATFNQSISELNATVSALKSKEDTATESGNNLDAAIDSMNKKIADVNSFLATTQQQIVDANSKFTSDQETSISELTKKLTDEINAIQSSADELDTRVAGIKSAVDALDIPKINADTATALANSKEAKDAVANKIDGATLNGTDVAVKDGKLDIKVADPDMSEYATNDSVDGKVSQYAKKSTVVFSNYLEDTDVPINGEPIGNTNETLGKYNLSVKSDLFFNSSKPFTLTFDWYFKGSCIDDSAVITPNIKHTSGWVSLDSVSFSDDAANDVERTGQYSMTIPRTRWMDNDFNSIEFKSSGIKGIVKISNAKLEAPKSSVQIWQGTANEYNAVVSKDDSTEYNVVDDTGIKNIYVGDSEIYKRGIPEGTVIYEDDKVWDTATNNFTVPVDTSIGTYCNLKNGFSFDDVKNGLMIGLNDNLLTGNVSYPRVNIHRFLDYDAVEAIPNDKSTSSGILYFNLNWNKIKSKMSVYKEYSSVDITTVKSIASSLECWIYKKDGSIDFRAKWGTNTSFQLKLNFEKDNQFIVQLSQNASITPSGSSQSISLMSYPVIQKIIAY